MATKVAGDLYADIDGQIMEIKRQLRQKKGYPYDPIQLVEHLQAAIKGKLVDRYGQPFTRASSRVVSSSIITCSGNFKASELVKAGKYGRSANWITDELFPLQPHPPMARKVEFIECDFNPSSEEALDELKRHGLKRPTAEDALEFGKQCPESLRKRLISFLHEPVLGPQARRFVLELDECNGERRLLLIWVGYRWSRRNIFAGVRE